MARRSPGEPTTDVVFALLPNVVLLDVAGPADAFRNAGIRVPGSYRLRFVAPQPALRAAVGLELGALETLPESLAPGSILVLTGLGGAGTDPALSPCLMHRNHLHPAVHRVQDAVARDPAARWGSAELSAAACTSPRNRARLLAEHAHCSPLDYVQLIRYAFARQLVTHSRLDLERVAAKSGFRSAQHLRRVWSRWEARPPSTLRGPESHAA